MKKLILFFFICFALVLNTNTYESKAQPQFPPGNAGAEVAAFNPTHRTEVDLWVRNDIPRYSFRTGKWDLGQQIGFLPRGTQIQVSREEIVGFTQSWLEIHYKLPDGRMMNVPGLWIWAGSKDARENVSPLQRQGQPQGKDTDRFLFSFVNAAWAQTDSIPGNYQEKPDAVSYTDKNYHMSESAIIHGQLDNWRVLFVSYFGIYLFLFLGMIIGQSWEWINFRPSSEKSTTGASKTKTYIKILVGSLISFSFFIGPIMGIGNIGLSISSAILAFHFGLVHFDPKDLVFSLREKYAQ